MIILNVFITALYLALVVFFAAGIVMFLRDRFIAPAVAALILLVLAIFYAGPFVLEMWGWRI